MTKKKTKDVGVVTVTDTNKDMAGAVTWWRLSGEVLLSKLQEAWEAESLDSNILPKIVTPSGSLNRAVHAEAGSRLLARPLGGRQGWALVQENPIQEDLEYETVLMAKVDKDGNPLIDSEDDKLAKKVRAQFDHYREAITPVDISNWLSSRLVDATQAVRLRDTGGIYFIPKEFIKTFRQWVGVIHDVSDHRIYEVPALRSKEAIQAIMDAFIHEIDQDLKTMAEEVEAEKLGVRALQTREQRCSGLNEKLSVYEKLLGKNMDSIGQRIQETQANIVEAIVAIQAEDEAETAG